MNISRYVIEMRERLCGTLTKTINLASINSVILYEQLVFLRA